MGKNVKLDASVRRSEVAKPTSYNPRRDGQILQHRLASAPVDIAPMAAHLIIYGYAVVSYLADWRSSLNVMQ
jgi:hypothetical protein